MTRFTVYKLRQILTLLNFLNTKLAFTDVRHEFSIGKAVYFLQQSMSEYVARYVKVCFSCLQYVLSQEKLILR